VTLERDERKRQRRERQVDRLRRDMEAKLEELRAERDLLRAVIAEMATVKGACRTLWIRLKRTVVRA